MKKRSTDFSKSRSNSKAMLLDEFIQNVALCPCIFNTDLNRHNKIIFIQFVDIKKLLKSLNTKSKNKAI